MAKNKSRNKKRTKQNVSIPYPGPIFPILITIAAIALVYLWICGRCETLAQEIGELEGARNALSQQLNLEKSRWARHDSMEGIQKGLARWNIKMSLPDQERVVYVRRRKLIDDGKVAPGIESLAMVDLNRYEQL